MLSDGSYASFKRFPAGTYLSSLMNKLQVMQTENRSKSTFSYPAFNFSNCNVTINYQQQLIHTEMFHFNILNKNLLHVLFFWKITKRCDLLTFSFCYKRYFYNVTLYILLLLLQCWIWVCFSFMSRMGCYVINILLSSPPLARTLYRTRQHYRKTVPSGVDNSRIIAEYILLKEALNTITLTSNVKWFNRMRNTTIEITKKDLFKSNSGRYCHSSAMMMVWYPVLMFVCSRRTLAHLFNVVLLPW